MHVQQAIADIKMKGLQEIYKKLVWAKKEYMENLDDKVLNCDLAEGEVKDSSPLVKSILGTAEAQVKVKSAVEHIASKIFQLSSKFLLEEARQPWNKILAKQIDSSLWKDLRDIVHNTPRSKTWDSFKECVTFHMLTLFRNDATAAQRSYISN